MAGLAPLVMSQTKEDLLRHLNLPSETYSLMAKETDVVYKWLTSNTAHLKTNCKRKPPYDWSDIAEKAKDEAMDYISRGGDQYTSYYWNLAIPTDDCPNWIARWFLYHKFRYRDGRNRNPTNKDDFKHRHGSSSKSHHSNSSGSNGDSQGRNASGREAYHSSKAPTISSRESHGHYAQTVSQTGSYAYGSQIYSAGDLRQEPPGTYWDPVRDV